MIPVTGTVLAIGDHVRLSKSDEIPSRYRGTIAEINTVFDSGHVGLFVKRRWGSLVVDSKHVRKIPHDVRRVFPIS